MLTVTFIVLLTTLPLLAACDDDNDEETTTTAHPTKTTEPTGPVGECTKEEIFRVGTTGTVVGASAEARDPSNEIAMDEINAMGGIKIGDTCVKFKYYFEDDKGTAGGATIAADKLIGEDHVKAIWHSGSIGTRAVVWQPYSEREKVIVFGSDYPSEWIGPDKPYSFRFLYYNVPQSLYVLDWASKNRPDIKTVHTIRMQSTDAEIEAETIEKACFPEYGIEMTGIDYAPYGTYDFYPILTSVLKHNPDAILVEFYPFQQVAKQARELGFEGTFLVIGAIPDYVFEAASPEDIEGAVSITPDPESPLVPQYYRDYRETYRDKEGIYPFSIITFPAYMSMYYLAAAIKAAGSTDTEKIREVMVTQTLTCEFPDGETLDVKLSGAKHFGANQIYSPPQYLSIIENGKPRMIKGITSEEIEQYMDVYFKYVSGAPPEETVSPPTTTAPPVTSKPPAQKVTLDSPVGAIMDLPGGEELLNECGIDTSNPQFPMMAPMSLNTVAPMSGGQITDEMLACIEEGLQALQGGGTP